MSEPDCDCVPPPSSGWADEQLKTRATLAFLDRDPATLRTAIAAHTGGQDVIITDEMARFLVEYPLDAAQLASIRDLTVADKWAKEILPMWDGYPDAFPIESWADVARLPALEQLVMSTDDALPLASDIANHPALRELHVLANAGGWPRSDEIVELVAASGFGPVTRTAEVITLARGTDAGPMGNLLVRVADFLPRVGIEEGKEYALVLVRAHIVDGALHATLRLNVTLPSGEVGDAQHQDLILVPADGTEEMLEAIAGTLNDHIVEHRTLPTAL